MKKNIITYLACFVCMVSTALAQEKLAFVPATLPTILAGSNTTITNNATGGNGSYTWFLNKGTLPSGLSLDSATGIISGVPSAIGSASVEVKVTDSSTPMQVAYRLLNLVINSDAPAFQQPQSLTAKVGTAFSYTFNATGGKTPYQWSTSSPLPSGISLNSTTGILSGTANANANPNLLQTYPITVTVTGSNSQLATKSFTLTVNPSDAPSITTLQLSPDAELGVAYSSIISASGGAGNYTFQKMSSTPSWLNLSSNGAVTGTPDGAVANTSLKIKVTDGLGRSSEKTVYVRVLSASIPSITSTSTGPAGSINTPYTYVLQASGGKTPYSWSMPIEDGNAGRFNLPPGLNLSANGTISGTPTQGGTFVFYPRVTDANGRYAIKQLTIVINDPTFRIVGTDISSSICGSLNQPYSTINGKSPYAWALTGAPSSSTVTINASTGVVTGNLTAVAPGNYTLTLRVRDSLGQNATATKTLTVLPATPLSWANTSQPLLARASEGTPYIATILINGGQRPYQYSLKSGSALPATLSLNSSTGGITGIPSTPGNYTFTITGADSCTGTSIDRTFNLIVDPMSVSCPPIVQNKCSMLVYTGGVVTGGNSPYTWTATPALPAPLTLNPTTGKIQGLLTAAVGNYTFVIKVTDKNGKIATTPLNITINPVTPLAWLSSLNLSDAYKSSPYSNKLSLSGGMAPYAFALKAGSTLPAGLSINATTGAISGTPTTTGNYTFTIVATESSCEGLTTEGVFNLRVLDPVALTGASVSGNKCSSIAPTLLNVTGGAAPFTWTTTPVLPAALTMNVTTGVISGNLTSPVGNYSVVVKATDKNGKSATAPFSAQILALPALTWVTSANLTDGYKSDSYTTQLSVTGGIAPYTFSLKQGSGLPSGLSLNATSGSISGTPTTVGNYTFTIVAKESSCDGLSIERAFTLRIRDTMVVSGPAISGNKCSSVASANYTVTGGASPYTWTTNPALPATLTMNATTGKISGSLTAAAGNYTLAIQATDKNGKMASKSITITIIALPTFTWVTTANLTDGYKASLYNNTLSVTGGIAPYTFSLKSGSGLPAGLSLNLTTGSISGTPTTAGNYTFTIVAKESSCDGLTIERTFNLQIYDPFVLTGSPISGIKCNAITPTSFPVSGGAAPYTWSTTPSPIVPSGLTINASTGVISGVVSGNAGSYSVVVKATDKNGRIATFTSNITITDPALNWVTAANLPDGYESGVYICSLQVSGGTAPYQYTLLSGSLPNNLTLNSTTGVIGGNLTTAGNYTFTIRSQDACGHQADRLFSLRVLKNVILSCLKEIWVVVDYIPGSHSCSDAEFNIFASGDTIMKANLNNVGDYTPCTVTHRDYKSNPTGAPSTFIYPHPESPASSSARYNRVLINGASLTSIAAKSPSGVVNISAACVYDYCSSGGWTTCHDPVGRMRVYTSNTTTGNFSLASLIHTESSFSTATSVNVTVCQNATISPPQALAVANATSNSVAAPFTLFVDAKRMSPNLSSQEIVKADHLVVQPFKVGRTEVTNQEYCDFLNAVANEVDPHGLYNAAMSSALNGGIARDGNAGAYAYSVKSGMINYPVVYVSWFDAARYVNWLSNGLPVGAQDKATTEDGAYALNGAVSGASIVRNSTNPNTQKKPKYWLLNEGEWYTAAYLKPTELTSVAFCCYPTRSDIAPDMTLSDERNLANYGNIFDGPTEVGFFSESPGPFGTLDQGGNVREWTESVDSGTYRIIRGGSWADGVDAMKAMESEVADPTLEDDKTGFRIGGAP